MHLKPYLHPRIYTMISQPSFSLPSSGVPPHSSQTQHFLEDSNDYTINFAQMEGIADALLRQQFPDPGLQSPSIFNPATLLESSPSTQPSNAAKKVALEAFLPKSLIFPVTDSAQSPACPSVEMLMEESAVNLRITAKKIARRLFQKLTGTISSPFKVSGRRS